MEKYRIFDNSSLLLEHPGTPHYKDDVVCFASGYSARRYPLTGMYFNRELYLILVLRGRSEISLNGEHLSLEAGTLLLHGANYLTDHIYSSEDISFITLSVSEAMLTNDSYLTQITAMLLATMRASHSYTISLTVEETGFVRSQLEALMSLLGSSHSFLFRRVQASCNALFLDIGDILSRKTAVSRRLSPKERVLQEFHALATRHFREQHFIRFYAGRLCISEQYLSRIVRAGTGKSVGEILTRLLVMEARMLLRNVSMPIGGIAAALHFGDASAFTKFFKRNTGITPFEFRENSLAEH